MKWGHLIGLVLIAASTFAAANGYANDPKHIERTLRFDSAIFSLKLNHRGQFKSGQVFEARIHVEPGTCWHIWACDMSTDGGGVPLRVTIPDSLSNFFELQSLKEAGSVEERYDSNFEQVTRAHYEPYDVIAKVKVKRIPNAQVPFFLYVCYQTCNETQCMPPRWFDVPMSARGEAPIMLTLGHVRNHKSLSQFAKS